MISVRSLTARFALEALIWAALLAAVIFLAACVSASYEHRTFYPPPAPKVPAQVNVIACSYQPDQGYAPSANRGPLKSETVVRGQDSRAWVSAAGGDGLVSNIFSFAGSNLPLLITGGAGVGLTGIVSAWQSWRNGKGHAVKDATIGTLQAKNDATWDEAYHAGYTAGVAAGSGRAIVASPLPTPSAPTA